MNSSSITQENAPLIPPNSSHTATTTAPSPNYALINAHIKSGTNPTLFEAKCRTVPYLGDLLDSEATLLLYVIFSLVTGGVLPFVHLMLYAFPNQDKKATISAYQQIHEKLVNQYAVNPTVNDHYIGPGTASTLKECEVTIPFTLSHAGQSQQYQYRLQQKYRWKSQTHDTTGGFFRENNGGYLSIEQDNTMTVSGATIKSLAANFLLYNKDDKRALAEQAFIETQKPTLANTEDGLAPQSLTDKWIAQIPTTDLLNQLLSVEIFDASSDQAPSTTEPRPNANHTPPHKFVGTLHRVRLITELQQQENASNIDDDAPPQNSKKIRSCSPHVLSMEMSKITGSTFPLFKTLYTHYCNQIKQAATRPGIDRVILSAEGIHHHLQSIPKEQQEAAYQIITELFTEMIVHLRFYKKEVCFFNAYTSSITSKNAAKPHPSSSTPAPSNTTTSNTNPQTLNSFTEQFWNDVNTHALSESGLSPMQANVLGMLTKKVILEKVNKTSNKAVVNATKKLASEVENAHPNIITPLNATVTPKQSEVVKNPLRLVNDKDLIVCDAYPLSDLTTITPSSQAETPPMLVTDDEKSPKKHQEVHLTDQLKTYSTLDFLHTLIEKKRDQNNGSTSNSA